jgi:hypothetical protein
MKRGMLLIICLLVVFSSGALAQTGAQSRRLTPAEIKAIDAAVQDEIYDYGYFSDFYQIGQNIGTPTHWIARSRIFINPIYNIANGDGQIIYKLMPYGQIYRLFYLSSGGGVQLDGDPQNHFPITQPSRLTVYMDEEEVCRYERTWIKGFFTIDANPSDEIIEAAAKRQKVRSGFSYWEREHGSGSSSKK